MVALVGMATAYAESALAQLYKVRNEDGQYRGGPAFYIAHGLNAPWAAAIFSVCLIISFGLVFNAVQANSIADAVQGAFGVPKLTVGFGLAVLSGVVIFGGIRQIARVAEIIVPFMAVAYLLMAVYVLIANAALVPHVLWTIVSSAFGLQEAAGGVTGGIAAAMLTASSAVFSPTRPAWVRLQTLRPLPLLCRIILPRRASFSLSVSSSTRF